MLAAGEWVPCAGRLELRSGRVGVALDRLLGEGTRSSTKGPAVVVLLKIVTLVADWVGRWRGDGCCRAGLKMA